MFATVGREADKAAERTGSEGRVARNDAPSPTNRVWENLALGGLGSVRVSTPEDASEREADQVAASVMRMPAPIVQRACAACSGGGGPCPACQGSGAEEEE